MTPRTFISPIAYTPPDWEMAERIQDEMRPFINPGSLICDAGHKHLWWGDWPEDAYPACPTVEQSETPVNEVNGAPSHQGEQ